MPRYFFNLVAPGLSLPDEEGTELPDLIVARDAAAWSARSIIDNLAEEGFDLTSYSYNVTDDRGEQVMIFEFASLLKSDANS